MSEESIATLRAQRDQLARALAERSAQLEAATREFEQFAYSISHDLRAPLRAVEGFAQILEEDYGNNLDAQGKRCIGILASGARKASLLLEDLVALSRLCRNPYKPEVVNMNELAARKIQELGPAAGKAQFRVGALPEAWGDPAWLGAALEQLLRNASKFSRGQEHPLVEIDGIGEARQTIYHIRDNGAGFDQKYADRLFGVFQRLHSEDEFEGRGIGLAIVQRVAHRHDGKAWAEGKVGQGATFFLSLPTRDATSNG
ncbi:MAG TPA: ATP-binding protein [Candidatus Baltobacteraceae bacterium]|jgi:light-regulated signal transduction histidine kinase (bacteriophytochrome)|nr:ATP-binding protein [Candidatus Baltobacteraceae bacterium]